MAPFQDAANASFSNSQILCSPQIFLLQSVADCVDFFYKTKYKSPAVLTEMTVDVFSVTTEFRVFAILRILGYQYSFMALVIFPHTPKKLLQTANAVFFGFGFPIFVPLRCFFSGVSIPTTAPRLRRRCGVGRRSCRRGSGRKARGSRR